MYLRLTQRRNRDGTVVRYVQLAHNRRVNGRPRAEVVANLGREDQIDVAALRRLVASIGRYLDRVEEAEQPDSGGVAPVRSGRPARRRSTGPGGSKPAAADRLGWAGPPAGLDRFVGRDAALADLPGLLSHHRLVTVSGPAGVGKTRLAVEFAHRAGARYRGGMWWVDLAPVPAGSPVDSAVAAALGACEQPARGLRDAIAEVCRAGSALLVLDSCEHVVDGCADLVTWLLGACPKLRLLATSREGLRVAGESRYPLAPLAVPSDPSGGREAGEVRDLDSVRLFADRARAVVPGFQLTDQLAAVIGELCARLDGLPLAIELTARQLTALTLAQLVERLDDRLDLLIDGSRTAPSRHGSLRAAIAWSYELLDQRERAVFRRLSALPGGFDQSGAGAMCADLDIGETGLWPLLRALVDKSMLVPDTAPARLPRFRMLESLRAFGMRQLRLDGEAADTEQRMLTCLAELAQPLITDRVVAAEVLDRLDTEHHNLHHAARTLDTTHDERYPLVATALAFVARKHGQVRRSRQLLEQLLARYPEPTPARAAALSSLAMTENWAGDYTDARRHAEQSLELARRLGSEPLQDRASQRLALTLGNLGDYAVSIALSQHTVAAVRASGNAEALPIALNDLAWLLVHHGDLADAADAADEALSVLSGSDKAIWDDILHTAGTIAFRQNRIDQAAVYFSMALATGVSYAAQVPYNLEGLGLVAAAAGRYQRALRLFAAAATARAETQRTADPWWTRMRDDTIAASRDRLTVTQAASVTAEGGRLSTADAVGYALRDQWPPARPGRTSALTAREHQVAQLVADGLTNPQIAARLGISPRTVVNHLEHIKAKLHLTTRAQVAAWTTRPEQRPGAAQSLAVVALTGGKDGPTTPAESTAATE